MSKKSSLALNDSTQSQSSLYEILKKKTAVQAQAQPQKSSLSTTAGITRVTSTSTSNLASSKSKSKPEQYHSAANLKAAASSTHVSRVVSKEQQKRSLGSTNRLAASSAASRQSSVKLFKGSSSRLDASSGTYDEQAPRKTAGSASPLTNRAVPLIVGSIVSAAPKPVNSLLEAKLEFSDKVATKNKRNWQQNVLSGKVAPAPGTVLVPLSVDNAGETVYVPVQVKFNQQAAINNFKLGKIFAAANNKELNPFADKSSRADDELPEEALEARAAGEEDESGAASETGEVSDTQSDNFEDCASDIDEYDEYNVDATSDAPTRLICYPATRLQSEMYAKTHPEGLAAKDLSESGASFDPLKCSSGVSCPEFYASQAYLISYKGYSYSEFYASLVEAVRAVLLRHKVLRTVLSRNDRILDADVQATIANYKSHEEIATDCCLEVVNYKSSKPFSLADLSEVSRKLAQDSADMTKLYRLVLVNLESYGETLPRFKSKAILVQIFSRAILDELSASRLCVELSQLSMKFLTKQSVSYNQKAFKGDKSVLEMLFKTHRQDKYAAKEYFRKLTTRLVQDDVLQGQEKVKVERQLETLGKERVNLLAQQKYLVSRKDLYGTELSKLKQQRLELENDDAVAVARQGGNLVQFRDKHSGDVVTVTPKVRQLVTDAMVTPSDAKNLSLPEGTNNQPLLQFPVVKFLLKHEFDLDAIAKVDSQYLEHIESFASLDDFCLSQSKLLTKQKRKILALSDFVANRILESVRERAKVLLQLERVVGKTRRTWEETCSKLSLVTDHLEYVEDMSMRLKYLLDPPLTHMKNPILTFKGLEGNVGIHDLESQELNYRTLYKFCPLIIDENSVQNLRAFRHAFHMQASQLRKSRLLNSAYSSQGDVYSVGRGDSSDSGLDSGPELGAPPRKRAEVESDKLEELLFSTAAMLKPCDAACLSAFGVLLRHVTGLEDFLIGNHVSFRHHEATVGPLSDMLPVTFNLKGAGLAFNQLLGNVIHQIRRSRRYGFDFPSLTLQSELQVGPNMPVQFQYITFAEAQRWKAAGMTLEDVLMLPSLVEEKSGWSRLWSYSRGQQFDLKLTLVEQEEAIIGGFHYRAGRFDAEKVERWATKYLTILKSIDASSSKKITLNGLVSKFYQSAWAASSPMDTDVPFNFGSQDECDEESGEAKKPSDNWSEAIHRRNSVAQSDAALNIDLSETLVKALQSL